MQQEVEPGAWSLPSSAGYSFSLPPAGPGLPLELLQQSLLLAGRGETRPERPRSGLLLGPAAGPSQPSGLPQTDKPAPSTSYRCCKEREQNMLSLSLCLNAGVSRFPSWCLGLQHRHDPRHPSRLRSVSVQYCRVWVTY